DSHHVARSWSQTAKVRGSLLARTSIELARQRSRRRNSNGQPTKQRTTDVRAAAHRLHCRLTVVCCREAVEQQGSTGTQRDGARHESIQSFAALCRSVRRRRLQKP